MFFADSDDDFYPEDYFDYMFDNMYDDVYDDMCDSDFLHSEDDNYEVDSYRSCPTEDELKQMNRCLAICSKLNEDRKEGLFCDATIVIEGKMFPVHKSVLKASSSYFSAMFVGSFSEKNEEEIEILGVSKTVFDVILDYMYGAAIKLTFENVKDIYVAGDMLCIDALIADCKSYIKNNWSASNDVQAVYEMAQQFEMTDITADIVNQVRANFSTCWGCGLNFKELSHSFLLTVLEGRNSVLQLKSESSIVKNVLQWAFHKPDERIPDLVLKVFSSVHFEFISEDVFRDILDFNRTQENSISTDILSCLKESLENLYHMSNQKIKDFGFRLVLPDYTGLLLIHVFDCESWKWEVFSCDVTKMPQSFVSSKNDLYIFTSSGGTKLDMQCKSEVALPAFPEKRIGSVFSVVDNTVYVTGGMKEGTKKQLGEILHWKPSTKYWKGGTIWRKPTSDASAITHGQSIYLVGGNSCSERRQYPNHTKCFVYNTQTRYFKRVCTLSVSLREPLLAIHEDVLYIFSNMFGHSLVPHVEAIDLKHQKVLTSDIKALDLHYPILSVCSVEAGILIAYSFDSKFLLTLYRPKQESASQLLGIVSSPIPLPEDRHFVNLKIIPNIPK